jgi:antitoxin component of RelBE/YafQ-DinJ toxin-antitoxin module
MASRLAEAKALLGLMQRGMSTPVRLMAKLRAKEQRLPFDETALEKIIADEQAKVVAQQVAAKAEEDRERRVREEQRQIRMNEDRDRMELDRQRQDSALHNRERELQLQQKELEIKLLRAQLRRLESPPAGFGTDSLDDDEDSFDPDDL